MNAIGLDVAVVGNHEFDFGTILTARRRLKSPARTNVQGEDGDPWGLVPR
jgi:2',3'-cyclic-nucleotide 2'-phosphodiesterase (5'-nucleotidase family)